MGGSNGLDLGSAPGSKGYVPGLRILNLIY